MPIPLLIPELDIQEALLKKEYDSLIVVSCTLKFALTTPTFETLDWLLSFINELLVVDSKITKTTSLHFHPQAPGRRLIIASQVQYLRDYDDVTNFERVAAEAILRAKDAGSQKPLFFFPDLASLLSIDNHFSNAVEVSLLGALAALYQPLQARETFISSSGTNVEQQLEPVKIIGFHVADVFKNWTKVSQVVDAIEQGRRLARDVGGPDPERMTPNNFALYVRQIFQSHGIDDTLVKIQRIDDQNTLHKEYPLLSAVSRASEVVPRHAPVVLNVEYVGSGKIEETLFLAGKGIVYDTGGADIKVGGGMAGMSRDKCGAAAVVGFVLTTALLKPKGLRVVGSVALVRNSCGADAYVSDEVIRAHSGVRVKVGNTDAEGRMVLSDILSHLRVKSLTAVNPRLMTIATLTGHAARSYGCYSALLDNGIAQQQHQSHNLKLSSTLWGDMVELSSLRHDDYSVIQPKTTEYDILQCNPASSVATKRGHQLAAAFILVASGLGAHGKHSPKPLPFTHIDIAGSAIEGGDYQFGKPTAKPLVGLVAQYVLPKLEGDLKKAAL